MADRRVFKRFVVTIAAVTVVAGSLVVAAGSAAAASYAGDLRIKGPAGSAYTQGPYVSQVGAENTLLTYTIQVINTGATVAQYNIKIVDDNPAAPAALYDGTLFLQPLASGPEGYYTKALAAHANQALTVKVKIPVGDPAYEYSSTIYLYATDGTQLDYVVPISEQAAPLSGGTSYDLFAKAGSQKLVGGGQDGQYATANTITATGTATFTVTLQNNSSTPSAIFVSVGSLGCTNLVLTVKQGSSNVTGPVLNDLYNTGTLAPKGKATLAFSVKATGATDCSEGFYSVATAPESAPTSFDHLALLIVNLAA